MSHEELISPDFLQIFVLVFVRLGIMSIVLPAALSQSLPIRFRIALTAIISFLVVLPKQAMLSNNMNVGFPIAVYQEVLLGLSLAMAASCFFYAFQMSGQLVSQMTGGSLVHPTAAVGSGSSAPLGTFFMLIAMGVFLISGNHRSVIDVVLNSVTEFPPGVGWRIDNSLEFLVKLLDFAFRVTIRIAAPIVICLVGTTLVMGLLAKLVSYFGFFTVGLSMNALVLIVTLLFSISAIVLVTSTQMRDIVDLVTNLFQLLRP